MRLPAISRDFARHKQIVRSILEHGGDNNYLSTRGGMRCWLRRSYLVDAEGEGVIPVPMAMAEWGTV